MAYKINIPGNIIYGKNALKESSKNIKELGGKALIVTDKIMIEIGNVKKVSEVLDDIGIKYEIYDGINSEPTDVMVDKGIEIYNNSHCDFLIAIGGGSPIDASKAIGAMITNLGNINDYMGKIIENASPSIVAIPTTAGTGSEATEFTIISNTKDNIKMLLKGKSLIPTLAIVDPQFSITVPQNITATTGIDALTHAIESYTSKHANSFSDTFALSAVKRIFNNLIKAYKDGKNFEARNEMALGALEAGIAFNNSSVTIVHGMSRPIGALFKVPHGLSNAVLLPKCLEFAIQGEEKRFADIAKAIEICKEETSDKEAAEKLVKEIESLCKDINIPTLEEYGIEKNEFYEEINKMAEDALNSGSPANTRRQPTKEDIVNIYKQLYI
ncbi:iron-containing alcohol dehydrogenase [Clostridium tetani]|uniref:1,3-propanediol dehydrogenase n=1 Tax=Clostridium tetani (strain Massachusetts / E88) TaxID=212717 RepID=Q898F2_CLOTE|nr:iron-containing alcohol dehydrogenase [Clostridium tetani]AAO35129.1 1,3-propanediol dehydrogenase [Clostridium tetani E88]KGI38970.1 alcohol dehydrogenase [Clostridium tetani]KGI46106.1 alcohol dehydrogenase [Clostridium tetani]KHO37958.1 alcohol dehydrogenase [Clostridium tetani]KIG20215.1 alcohol dehydrogenase [Clostridium tetani]